MAPTENGPATIGEEEGRVVPPPSVQERVQRWLETYGDVEAEAAMLLCDRHPPEAVAFTFVGPDLSAEDLTFGQLADRSRRLATVLRSHGVGPRTHVAVLLGKQPGLVVTMLALWRLGAVLVPLFTAFERGAIQTRVDGSGAGILISEAAHSGKAAGIGGLRVLDIAELARAAAEAEPLATNAAVGGDGTIIEIFTSGTTGPPKGVPVPLRILGAVESYLVHGLDVRPDDVYWNAADPGWAYGLYCGVLGPLARGQRAVMSTAGFSPTHLVDVVRTHGVTNFAGAPTMYRALRTTGVSPALELRRASSAGEPLNPDLVTFGASHLGSAIRDHYGQTELAMVLCNHWHPDVAEEPVPGSMGQALPGFAVTVVDGQVAVDVAGSPLMWFTGYTGDPARSAARFTADGRHYLTSDLGRIDDDGNVFFVSRDDDVILAAGYRIGPGDVEGAIVTYPGVAEVAVVGRPDPTGVRGEQVEAFVVLAGGVEPTDKRAAAIADHVRATYSKHAYPRRVHFVEELPKTPSGKILRYVLREGSRQAADPD